MGREEQIFFLGRLDRTQVVKEMQMCDSFVLPSRHETFGLVWREAMCVGRPVITTDHGGFGKEDFNEDFGMMIPVDDLMALQQALLKMRSDYFKYDLKKISEQNRDMYSSKLIARRIINIFEKLKEETV